MRLGVEIGEGDDKMRNLPCRLIQVDEVGGVCRNEANAFSKKLENFKDAVALF
jgi:hypothetical protein